MNKEIKMEIEQDLNEDVINEEENKRVNPDVFLEWKTLNYDQLINDWLEDFEGELTEDSMNKWDKEEFNKYCIEIFNEIGGD